MTLKTEILQELNQGAGHETLLTVVRRYKSSGMSQREAYEQLEGLWKDFGFNADEHDEANPLRDNLEYVMEVVWGFCPRGAAVWEVSLSNE